MFFSLKTLAITLLRMIFPLNKKFLTLAIKQKYFKYLCCYINDGLARIMTQI